MVSIHAPAGGATRAGRKWNMKAYTVSIHAPAGGATPLLLFGYTTIRGFNPRTRRGCDYFSVSFLQEKDRFQSTHPQGVRLFLP